MELVLKNISPKDHALIADLAQRLGFQVEEKIDKPDHILVADDLKETLEEIKMANSGKIKLQSAKDLISEL
jgi:hypothetical protein